MDNDFSSLLFTGGCGFIGSNVCLYLLKANPNLRVINIDKMDYSSRQPDIPHEYMNRYTFVRANVADKNHMLEILNKYKVDVVVHMAAQTHVDRSFGNSIQFTQDNILGTHSLLEACRFYGDIKRFIHVSTDECYGEVDDHHKGCKEHESHLNPTNPYAATKVGAEYLVKSYGHSFNFPYIITRGNNVYGPQQYPDKIIPLFTKLLLQGKPCTIHGEGKARRNFIHVNDVSKAFQLILQKGKLHEIYNIGTKDEFSVLDIAQRLISIIHPEDQDDHMKHIIHVPDREFNDYRYAIDTTALEDLGWKQEIQFCDGLRQTVRWYQNNVNYWKPNRNVFLLYGWKGWIGEKFCKALENTPDVEYVKGTVRVDDFDAVTEEVDRVNPSHIISMIGRTHGPGCGTIDWLEEPGRLVDNIRDNLYAPLNLANICREKDIHLTYLGTGCIFKYDGDKRFSELDLPNFFGSSYSIVKGFTDRIMKQYEGTVLNCRIRMPISSDNSPRNFITKITTYEKICSVPNSMTVLEEFIPIIIEFAMKGKTGTYNMTNPGVISHNEILDMHTDIVDKDFKYQNFSEEEMRKILKSDRSNNYLNTSKLEKEYPKVRCIREAVRDTLLEMKMNRV